MKISEMIHALQAAKAKIGDVPVRMADDLEVLAVHVGEGAVYVSDVDEEGRTSKEIEHEASGRRYDLEQSEKAGQLVG